MSSKQLFPQNLMTSSLLLYSSLTLIDGFMSLIHSASSVSRCTSPRRVIRGCTQCPSHFDHDIKGDANLYFRYMNDISRNVVENKLMNKLEEVNSNHKSLIFTHEREGKKVANLGHVIPNVYGTPWIGQISCPPKGMSNVYAKKALDFISKTEGLVYFEQVGTYRLYRHIHFLNRLVILKTMGHNFQYTFGDSWDIHDMQLIIFGYFFQQLWWK